MSWYIVAVVLLSWTAIVSGYQSYQAKIPNGNSVPHPCTPGSTWQGVGHKASGGGGERNPFGLDFAANSRVWNPTLCQKDSDGDGKTNGEELGDPSCTWTEGGNPSGSAVSHPGICDPIGSDVCKAKNTFLTCSASGNTGTMFVTQGSTPLGPSGTTPIRNPTSQGSGQTNPPGGRPGSAGVSWKSSNPLFYVAILGFLLTKCLLQ